MSREPLDCSTVIDRLIEGERPTSDQRLSEHVGSCLTCFRTANDLKGLPTLRRQLLDAGGQSDGGDVMGPGADPGAAFWAAFPAQVANAWQAARTAAEQEAAALVAAQARPSWRERISEAWAATRGWLRLPGPAALGGALCAAAIILVAIRPWTSTMTGLNGASGTGGVKRPAATAPFDSNGQGAPNGQGAELASGAAAAMNSDGAALLPGFAPGAGSLMPGGAMDDSLKELDVEGLRAVRAGLERSLVEGQGDETRTRAPVEGDVATESNPTALSDELEELNDAGLTLLSQSLEGT
jgi:hypothetical protein